MTIAIIFLLFACLFLYQKSNATIKEYKAKTLNKWGWILYGFDVIMSVAIIIFAMQIIISKL